MKYTPSFICRVGIAWCLAFNHYGNAQNQPSLQNLIIFGDGYSDSGNTFILDNNTWPQRPYFRGRFSNDQVWSELVLPPLNMPLSMYAYGGCRADEVTQTPNSSEIIPSITQQMRDFLSVPTDKILRSLAVVFFSGAEFLEEPLSDPNQVIKAFRECIYELSQSGVHNIILTTLPPLDRFPGVQFDRIRQYQLRRIVDTYNRGMISLVNYFARRRKIILWDIHNIFSQVMDNDSFRTIHKPCLFNSSKGTLQQCNYSEDYLFWDTLHVTSNMHRLLAKSFVHQVSSSWPDIPVWGDV
ncbi:hypothetical protein K7432_002968 [Basidiobolus ranarum]|uniref:Uncharacterized protein n=1 Tax=Basidiobolus ranarum TaxID=34480 RepID=A0ABR2W7W5_9FUNG